MKPSPLAARQRRSRPLFNIDPSARSSRLGAALLSVLAIALVDPAVAAEPPERPVDPPNLADLQTRGTAAVREWVDKRRDANKSRRDDALKELDACLELAGFVYNEAGGEVIEQVLAEAEAALARASELSNKRGNARRAAMVGEAYERLAGAPQEALRLYEIALAADSEDAVAREGIARLELAEAIDAHKELEVERMKELEEFWSKQPRSLPPERLPFGEEIVPQP
ncbi:MAG: hypothetical protein ACREIA_15080 [Opitutaceae bacterium]